MKNKRFFSVIRIITMSILMCLLFVACTNTGETGDQSNDDEVTTESIRIDTFSIPETVYAGQIPFRDIYLVVTKSDGTEERVPLSEEYIAVSSRNKLSQIGTHQLEVVYENCTTSFQIVLVDPSVVTYLLVVEGGVPVSVNGKAVSVEPPVNGVYTNRYTGGTVVEIAWTAEKDRVFATWEADGASVDNQSVTTVYMTSDHVYRAKSYKIIYTVNFTTFKENFDIPAKEVERLYLSAADMDVSSAYYDVVPAPTMDGYVFAGWTLDEITLDQSLSGSGNFPLVNFVTVSEETGEELPYLTINKNLSFYAVWTPTKMEFTTFTPSISGYTQKTGYQLVEYNGNLTDLVIPSIHDGMEVLAISNKTFLGENASYIETITIPSTVLEIEEGTFMNCSSLRSIYVGQDSPIFSSENEVLYKDERTNLVAYPANKVARIYEMESTVSSVSPYAFYNAVVGEIKVSPEVTSIGDHAFDSVHIDTIDFSELAVIKLDSLKSYIGEGIFNDNLSYVLLSPSDQDKADYARLKCFRDFSERFTDGGNVHRIGTNVYGEYTILFRLISGGNLAPYFVNTGSTAEIIGASRNMSEIFIPNELLYGSTNYTVSSIGYYAFKDCKKLSLVDLPDELERVSDKAFDDTPWAKGLANASIIDNQTLYKYIGNERNYNLPADIRKIAESAFRNNKTIEFLNISSNVNLETVSAMAFYGCEKLNSFSDDHNDGNLIVKPFLKTIGAYAFAGTGIEKIVSFEGSALSSIKEFAFNDCKYLNSASFTSKDLREISSDAFLDTDSLLYFDMAEDNDFFSVWDGVLYEITGQTTASLFAYPAGKMTAVFDPSVFTKKFVPINGDTFSVLGQEYDIVSQNDSTVVGNYTSVDTDGVEVTNTFTLSVSGGRAYYNVRVRSIGENALYHSNIGALRIEADLISIPKIKVPGLTYVQFDAISALTYNGLFRTDDEISYEPLFVCFPNNDKGSVVGFFNSNEALCDEKYVGTEPVVFFDHENKLYYIRNDAVTLARTTRSESVLNIPETVTDGINDYTQKSVAPFAFGGWYLTEIFFEKGITSVQSSALDLTHRVSKVYFTETDESKIPMVYKNSLGDDFDNGLLVFIPKTTSEYYIDKWNSGSENIISSFEYTVASETRRASSYLIEYYWDGQTRVPEPFAILTFKDDNGDVVTVGDPIYGIVTATEIQNFYDDDSVQKEGYVVGGWSNDKREEVVLGSLYEIPYNQILTCGWEPRVYTIYLDVYSEYDLSFDARPVSDGRYVVEVEYHSSYDWNVLGFDKNYYYLNGWKYNSSVGTKTIPAKGVWSLALDSEADQQKVIVFVPDFRDRVYTLEYKCEGELSNLKKSVGYNRSYDLDIPEKVGYAFDGWYYTFPNGETVMLTNDQGKSKQNWSFTNEQNDTYGIYPKWKARVLPVALYLDSAKTRLYQNVTVEYDSEDFEFTPHLSDEEEVRFSGWSDADGVIYTDTDGKSIKKWDKWAANVDVYELFAVWPIEVSNLTELTAALNSSMNASVLLTDDITLNNVCFGDIDRPYGGVFNGNGHTVTFSYNDNTTHYTGLFIRNEGIIKNLNFTVDSYARNLPKTPSSAYYLGTLCAVNNGIISNVNVVINDYYVKVDSQYFCFYDISDAFHIGIVCGENNGKISGQCEYNYDKDVVYYKNDTNTAVDYYKASSWKQHYSEFYVFDENTSSFMPYSVPFDDSIRYYTVTDNDYVDSTTQAFNDHANGLWNTRYEKYYYFDEVEEKYINVNPGFPIAFNYRESYYIIDYDEYLDRTEQARRNYEEGRWERTYDHFYRVIDGQYVCMTECFESENTYYVVVEDIFKGQTLFYVGSGTNTMNFVIKEK